MTLELMPGFRFSCGFRNVAFWLVGAKFYPLCVRKVSGKTIFDGLKKKEGLFAFSV